MTYGSPNWQNTLSPLVRPWGLLHITDFSNEMYFFIRVMLQGMITHLFFEAVVGIDHFLLIFMVFCIILSDLFIRVSLNALHKFTPCTPKVSAYGVHSKHCWSTDPCTPRAVECSSRDFKLTGVSHCALQWPPKMMSAWMVHSPMFGVHWVSTPFWVFASPKEECSPWKGSAGRELRTHPAWAHMYTSFRKPDTPCSSSR